MTWNDLKNTIGRMTPEQQGQDVTVFVSGLDEYYGLVDQFPMCESDETCDVLDLSSPFLVLA
jgi:hypothetical protein